MVQRAGTDRSLRSVSRASLGDGPKSSAGAFNRALDGSGTKITQVMPSNSVIKRALQKTQRQKFTFSEAFGAYGVPILFVLVLCFTWTAWLIFVSQAPNEAANMLMGTSDYDDGQFWLIIDTNPFLTSAGVCCLVVVGFCYLFVMLQMVLWREKVMTPAMIRRVEERMLDSWKTSQRESRTLSFLVGPSYQRVYTTWRDLTSFNGKNRKLWNLSTKIIDLIMQTIVLLELLKRGSPVELVYGYACFVAANALSCATNIVLDRLSSLTEVQMDSTFDFAAAVLFPISTLVFCYYNFEFDREVYLTYLEILLSGNLERVARTFANQSEIALFRVSFDSLRFSSPLDLCIRTAINLAFCYRIKRVLEVMIWRRHHEWISGRTLRKSSGTIVPIEHNTAIPKVVGAALAAFTIAVLVLTQQSIMHSKSTCAAFPECVVYSHRLTTSGNSCPCLIFIDVDKFPKTYEEWIHPPDVYDKLKAVSAFGLLESVQIINRQLLEFPQELRLCRNLRAIHLMYTGTRSLPAWAGELKNLETLHIEGKLGSQNLRELPGNLFANMPRLTAIHFGVHEGLGELPPLTGVPQLQSLSLAWIFALHHLPAFDFIPNLLRLNIAFVPSLEAIPDMTPLNKLVDFSGIAGVICCNGFLGPCDLTDMFCAGNPSFGISPASCLLKDNVSILPADPYLGSAATKAAFEKFGANACFKVASGSPLIDNTPTKEKVDMCGGKPFRECHLPGNVTGICANVRFQVLSCVNDDNRIALRRFQIEKGVGSKCNPVEEKWLGCGD